MKTNPRIEVYPIRSELVRPGDSLVKSIITAISKTRIRPRDGDILAVASKTLAISQRQLIPLSMVRPSSRAAVLAKRFSMLPASVQIVLEESDRIYSGVQGALLTLKDGDAIANAGADLKNAPKDHAVLWPRNPTGAARRIRQKLEEHYGKKLGIVLVDSRVAPLRLGTIGLALGTAGFQPVKDLRGTRDLYGRMNRLTAIAVADGIADMAHFAMGESYESTPYALVRGAFHRMDGRNWGKKTMLLSPHDCLYMSSLVDRDSRI